MEAYLSAFFNDQRVQIVLLLLILRFALGVIAAFVNKEQSFRLSYVADIFRNDVLGKVFPFFILYGGYLYAKGAEIIIPGLDMELLMNGAWVVILAAFVGAILNSLRDLGLFASAPDEVAGPDPSTPL